ncbi:hypothetical protein GCM10022394_03920 [Zobellella aerophila]|uniref:Transposase IS4 N-terminal domain-containing protein n=1 Tax=Zobellella aerophila TaxID=870480 RepID=A0ABP6V333_9GAMM
MQLSQALDAVHQFTPEEFAGLSDLLSPGLIEQCLIDTGVASLRKQRLAMEVMVWAVVGISLYHHLSMSHGCHSLTLFDRGFYALGLLHRWQSAGSERHWLLPLRKGAQYQRLRKLVQVRSRFP